MSRNSFSYKTATSGCCRKCGKPLEWKPASTIGMESTTGCMVTAESHIQELQKDVARNTLYCSDCSAKLKDDIILSIVLFPFNIIKVILKPFIR